MGSSKSNGCGGVFLFEAHLAQVPLLPPPGPLVVMVTREFATIQVLVGPPETKNSAPEDLHKEKDQRSCTSIEDESVHAWATNQHDDRCLPAW